MMKGGKWERWKGGDLDDFPDLMMEKIDFTG